MANFYKKLEETLKTPLSTLGATNPQQLSAMISSNLRNPVGADPNKLKFMFGSEDDFMARYQNFEQLYKAALQEELQSTALSASRKRMIQGAMDAPVINLNLVGNYKARQSLISHLNSEVLPLEGLIKNFGAPGVGMPSSNLFRGAARYMTDMLGGGGHPVLSLINSLTFNIDPTKAGIEAFGYGKSNLPSAAALRASSEMSQRISRGPAGRWYIRFFKSHCRCRWGKKT
jgi:hypothetical protein